MAIGDAHLKVILESGILADPEKIWKASLLSLEAGADFIKTSTGKTAVSATPEAAVVMCHALKYWYDTTGQMRGFKPAGGISSPADALVYMTLVLNILGKAGLITGCSGSAQAAWQTTCSAKSREGKTTTFNPTVASIPACRNARKNPTSVIDETSTC